MISSSNTQRSVPFISFVQSTTTCQTVADKPSLTMVRVVSVSLEHSLFPLTRERCLERVHLRLSHLVLQASALLLIIDHCARRSLHLCVSPLGPCYNYLAIEATSVAPFRPGTRLTSITILVVVFFMRACVSVQSLDRRTGWQHQGRRERDSRAWCRYRFVVPINVASPPPPSSLAYRLVPAKVWPESYSPLGYCIPSH